MDVMPRLVWPSWRWMTISGTPSRAISTACAWRSWWGAKRRRTPASRATRRSSERAAAGAQVGLCQGERLADAQPGAPEHDDQAAQPPAVDAVAGAAHHGHDLFDRGRVCGVADPFVARRPAGMELRQRRG